LILFTLFQSILISIYTVIVGAIITFLVALIRVPGIQNVAYQISRFYCLLVLKTSLVKIRVTGMENINIDEQYVFMSNHSSYYDIPATAFSIEHQMRWVYKKELAKIPFLGWALRSIGHIMVDRGNRTKAIESIRESLSHLKGNTSIMIFPEGTRSRSGELLPFKKGGFHIALQSGFPIVPVAVKGSRDIMKKGTFRIHSGTIHIRIFPPIPVKDYGISRINELKDRVRALIESEV
jgi:1-acyl-sn-glycerol-3-phosphate acyltransferase